MKALQWMVRNPSRPHCIQRSPRDSINPLLSIPYKPTRSSLVQKSPLTARGSWRPSGHGRELPLPRGISGDVVELVELLGPAVFQYLVNIEKARTPQHDARNVLEPTEGFGRASCLLLLSGKMWKLSKVIPVIQQRPLLFREGGQPEGEDRVCGSPAKLE